MWVPSEGDASELEAKRVELEVLLNQLTAEADETVGRRADRR